jgi:hypothetical protein
MRDSAVAEQSMYNYQRLFIWHFRNQTIWRRDKRYADVVKQLL